MYLRLTVYGGRLTGLPWGKGTKKGFRVSGCQGFRFQRFKVGFAYASSMKFSSNIAMALNNHNTKRNQYQAQREPET